MKLENCSKGFPNPIGKLDAVLEDREAVIGNEVSNCGRRPVVVVDKGKNMGTSQPFRSVSFFQMCLK